MNWNIGQSIMELSNIPELACDNALQAIQAMPNSDFDELVNPFESKLVVRDKFNLPSDVEYALTKLEGMVVELAEFHKIKSLMCDEQRHYAGVFKYRRDGYLFPHVDAGIHPATGKRKHITVLLYLGECEGGELEFWSGDNCAGEDPKLHELLYTIKPEHGKVVVFVNNDYAWHSAAKNTGDSDRIVMTVSFLSDEVDAFDNKRQRAFFAPRPNEVWTPEMYELRNKRSSSTDYASVYRAGKM